MKKTMSLVLAITMVLSVLAITPVMAETTGVPTDQGYTIVPAVAGIYKEYGWKVYDADSDGTAETLEIYYTGTPKNYDKEFSDRPWQSEIANITAVVIKGTPNKVGEYAFSGMENLKSVVFAGTEKSIEKQAFSNCKALTGVFVVPKSVESIKNSAFMNTRITSMIFEGDANTKVINVENLVYLGELTNITLFRPLATTSTTVQAFGGTYAAGVYGMTNPAIIHMLVADASYITPFANLIEYTASFDTTSTNAQKREYSIAPGKFGEYTLFDRTKGVTYGEFADHVQYMLYYENNGSDLTAEFITDGGENGENGENLVRNGYTVEDNKYTIKDTVLDTNVANIKKMVFGTGFTTIPENFGTNSGINDELYGEGKSTRYENLKEVKFPATLTTIGKYAFNRVKTLSKVNLEDTKVVTIPNRAFNGCTFKEVTFPETIRTVGLKTFSDNPDLEYVYFPKATNLTISQNAFTKDILSDGFAGKNLKVIFDEVEFTTVNAEAFCTNNDRTSDQWRKTTVIYNHSKTNLPETAPNGITPVADKYYEVSDADNNGNINLFMCNFDAAQNYKLFMGTYAGNALNNAYMLKEGTLTTGSFINTELDTSANIVSGHTKVFLWDGFAKCKPLTTGIFTK